MDNNKDKERHKCSPGLSVEHSSMQDKVQCLRTDLDVLTKRVDKFANQLQTGVMTRLNVISMENQERLEQYQQDANSLRSRLQAMQEELTAKEQDIQQLKQDKALHLEEILQLKASVSELQTSLQEREEVICHLHRQVQDLQTRHNATTDELKHTNERLETAEGKLGRLESTMEELKQVVDVLRYAQCSETPDTDVVALGARSFPASDLPQQQQPQTSYQQPPATRSQPIPHPQRLPAHQGRATLPHSDPPRTTSSSFCSSGLPRADTPRAHVPAPVAAMGGEGTPRQTKPPSRMEKSSFRAGSSWPPK